MRKIVRRICQTLALATTSTRSSRCWGRLTPAILVELASMEVKPWEALALTAAAASMVGDGR